MGGYTLAFQYFIHQSEVKIVKEIYENKVDSAKLVEIKIPVHLPGIHFGTEYNSVQGQLQLKGVFYNYLRYKVSPDTMSFICIANSVKTRLVSANLIIAKEINDVPISKRGHDASLKKVNFGIDYSIQLFNYKFSGFSTLLKANTRPISYLINSPIIELHGKPPDSNC